MTSDQFGESKLLAAFTKAGGSRDEFLRHGTESLNDTDETQLRSAGVSVAGTREFLARAKAILGQQRFGEVIGDYRDRLQSQDNQGAKYPGRKVRNPTGNLVKLILWHVERLPAARIAAGQGSIQDFIAAVTAPKKTTLVINEPDPEIPPLSHADSLSSPTRQTRVLRKIALADAIQGSTPIERDRLAYASAPLVQANLPHTDPGQIEMWERRNGDFSFVLQPGYTRDDTGAAVRMGCPYGMFPRLTLIHIVSMVKRTGDRRIKLADTFYEFLRTLGVSDSKQNYLMAREQLTRLLSANLQFLFRNKLSSPQDGRTGGISRTINSPIAKDYVLWWADPHDAFQTELFESFVLLDQDFYESIVGSPDKRGHAFPLDLDTVAAIRKSSLQLDMYQWMVHRIHRLHRDRKDEVLVNWQDLHEQFGCDYKHIRQFRAKAIQSLANIATYWRGGLQYSTSPDGLLLKPSPLPVDPYSKKLMG